MTFDLVCLQYDYYDDTYDSNLAKLLEGIEQSPSGSFICASELCLTNFSYAHMDKAAKFSQDAFKKILPLTKGKTLCLSIIEKTKDGYTNSAKIIHDGQILHTQPKHKLFTLGEELKYFQRGTKDPIRTIQVGDLKVAVLICFELRFIELWEQLRGADIIFVPALWGKPRKEHLENISKTLAILHQCFVLVSNATNDDMASSSSITTPMGIQYIDDTKDYLTQKGSLKDIELARRYLDMN